VSARFACFKPEADLHTWAEEGKEDEEKVRASDRQIFFEDAAVAAAAAVAIAL